MLINVVFIFLIYILRCLHGSQNQDPTQDQKEKYKS